MKIVLFPAPFSWGPATRAFAIADAAVGHEPLIAATRTVGPLAVPSVKDALVEFVDEDEPIGQQLAALAGHDGCIVSISDPRAAAESVCAGRVTAFLDSVTGWRRPVGRDFAGLAGYLYQAFPGAAAALHAHWGNEGPEIVRTGAILRSRRGARSVEPHVVVTFGGLRSPFQSAFDERDYPAMMLDLVAHALRDAGCLESALFCGPEAIIHTLPASVAARIECTSPSHPDFLCLLDSATVAVATPGIETFYEVSAARAPYVPLPPQNSTQYVQLSAMVDAGLVAETFAYANVGYDGGFRSAFAASWGVESREREVVTAAWTGTVSDRSRRDSLVATLSASVAAALGGGDAVWIARRSAYLDEIGSDGATEVVSWLEARV